MKSRGLLCVLLPVLLVIALSANPGQAQQINIRVSVKFILSPTGVRPTGLFTDAEHWRQAIDVANAGQARLRRGFRYLYPTFDGDVSGYGQYYDLQDGEEIPFEYAMRTAAASQTHWRNDALNVYVVHSNLGTASNPGCAGWASDPQDYLSDTPPYNTLRGGIVVFCVNMSPAANPLSIVAHEFGHHQGLIHTWADDRVDDTPVDADPGPCEQTSPTPCECKFNQTVALALSAGWSAEVLRTATNNLMSYHCDNDNDFELTEGQLDRWADMTRMYLAQECTGVTRFVQAGSTAAVPDGYSRSYFSFRGLPIGGPHPTVAAAVSDASAAGGDILVLRPGHYNEPITIKKPLTLRPSGGGWATIGTP